MPKVLRALCRCSVQNYLPPGGIISKLLMNFTHKSQEILIFQG